MSNTGLVVGKFAPFHKGHALVINRALECSSKVIVLVYSNPDFDTMPSVKRAEWIKEIYDGKAVQVFVPDKPPLNSASDFVHREFVKHWLKTKLAKIRISKIFGSEDYIKGFANHLNADFELVDGERSIVKTSGTSLRKLLENQYASTTELQTYLHPIVLKSF